MGKRRLAYTVKRFHEGIYVLIVVEGGGAVVHELERRLRVTEQVIKFLTVRTDEEQKRLDKIKALRDSKKKVSAQPVAPAPVVAAVSLRRRLRWRKLRRRRSEFRQFSAFSACASLRTLDQKLLTAEYAEKIRRDR